MAEYHVGCGLAGIYAGRLKKNGYEWIEKSDVTKEVLQCAMDYLYTNEIAIKGTFDGKKYIMSVVPITENEENELRKYEAKVITRGKCMACGKELTEGLFFCKECEEKGRKER